VELGGLAPPRHGFEAPARHFAQPRRSLQDLPTSITWRGLFYDSSTILYFPCPTRTTPPVRFFAIRCSSPETVTPRGVFPRADIPCCSNRRVTSLDDAVRPISRNTALIVAANDPFPISLRFDCRSGWCSSRIASIAETRPLRRPSSSRSSRIVCLLNMARDYRDRRGPVQKKLSIFWRVVGMLFSGPPK